MALPAFAAQRRAAACAAAPLLLGDRRCGAISPARTALSSKPAARSCCGRMTGQTDRQTDTRPLNRPCSAHEVGSANKLEYHYNACKTVIQFVFSF